MCRGEQERLKLEKVRETEGEEKVRKEREEKRRPA